MNDDAISRQEAISAIIDEYYPNAIAIDIVDTIANLPSVTPKAEQKAILDKIRAEIENHCGLIKEDHCKYCGYCNSVMGVREILQIIDKYKVESEDKE